MEHILIHCAEYFHVRIQCFDVDNLQELFNTVSPDTIYVICVDSLSCLQAIEHQHIDHPLVLDVLDKYSALVNKTLLFCWVPSHVGIQGNELADTAAKAALNERLTIMTLAYSDFKPLVKEFIRGKWSDFWATQINNKLHSVQPTWAP